MSGQDSNLAVERLAQLAAARPRVDAFFDEATFTVSYLVSDPATGRAAIVDPVLDYDPASGRTGTAAADRLLAQVEAQRLAVDLILETHVHADHLTAAPYLRERTGATLAIGANITTVQQAFGELFNAEPGFRRDGSQFDRLLRDADRFAVGSLEGHALHTPGHTPNCMVYVIGDAAFVGDTLFMPDYGTARCDFPGGDLWAMLATMLLRLVEGVETGILAGVAPSVALHLYRTSRPHRAVVGQLPGTQHYRNVKRHRAVTTPEVFSLRVDESLYFPNARFLEDLLSERVAAQPSIRHVVLMCPAVNDVDASAPESLEVIDARLAAAGVTLQLSEVKGPVMDRLRRSRFLQTLRGRVCLSHYEAMQALAPHTTEQAATARAA